MEGFKLGVEILLVISRVDVGVETCAVFLVRSEVFKTHNIPTNSQVSHVHSNSVAFEISTIVFLVLVDCELGNSKCL